MSDISPIPGAILAASAGYLLHTGTLSDLADGYFSNLTVPEQVCLLGMLFAVVFLAVSVSQFVDPLGQNAAGGGGRDPHRPPESSDGKDVGKGVGKGVDAEEEFGTPRAGRVTYPLSEMGSASTERERFLSIFPTLRDGILSRMESNEMPPEALDWCREMMNYNVPGGKLNRGMTVVSVRRTLVKAREGGRELTPVEEAKAAVLGWAIEFLQAFFLVADDVMDGSETRRGRPCWYKVPKVSLIAVNDSFLLESYVFTMVRDHFGSEPYYPRLLHLFLETVQQTEFGQLLDLTSQPVDSDEPDLERFTMERYRLIVKYKTCFYSFYLPVAIGMIMSGIADGDAYEAARRVLHVMGEYFQVQDDYLDCFGDPETIGKVGTDIQDNKCSWLVVQALDRATIAQRRVLERNYGRRDDGMVSEVKALYEELGLPEAFERYEEESYERIGAELDGITSVPREVFEMFLEKIYKRKH